MTSPFLRHNGAGRERVQECCSHIANLHVQANFRSAAEISPANIWERVPMSATYVGERQVSNDELLLTLDSRWTSMGQDKRRLKGHFLVLYYVDTGEKSVASGSQQLIQFFLFGMA